MDSNYWSRQGRIHVLGAPYSFRPESDMRPRSTPRVLPAQTDLGFAPLSTTSRFARTKADRCSFATRDRGRRFSSETGGQGPARSPQVTLVAVSIEPPDGYWFSVAFHRHLAQRSCWRSGGAQRCHH